MSDVEEINGDDMTVHPLESVLCIKCQKPTGMPTLDPRTIPPGCAACLAVICGDCRSLSPMHRSWQVRS